MTQKFALPQLKAPLERIDASMDAAIAGLATFGSTPVWKAALDAVLVTHRAPKHLVRAQLVLLGALAGGGAADGVANAALERLAAGVELFHLFMLVHDDVMDRATLRRNKPTVHCALVQSEDLAAKGGGSLSWRAARDMAIVVGNALSLLACRYVTESASPNATALLFDASFTAGAAQLQDLAGFRDLEGESGLRRELVAKTAYHSFSAPIAAGVMLANGDSRTSPLVEQTLAWGEHVGVAFQTNDDLSDLVLSPAQTGKDALRDLFGGRPSLALYVVREHARGEDRAFLDSLVGREVIELGDRARFDDLLRTTGALDGCAARVREEIAAAAKIADAAKMPPVAREGMRAVELGLLAHLDEILASAVSE
jgi:geranylgeranyl diphosphate synthase type I